jgi:AcrR family transcriptional regulator
MSMSAHAAARKGQRAYDSSGRRARARQQHETTLDHARRLFLQRGYANTNVDAIAEAAGISPATVYKTYGGKAGLLRSLCERALVGEQPVPAETRSNALRSSDDPHRVLEGWAALVAEVSPHVSPLMLLLRAASEVDDEAAELLAEFDAQRLHRMTENAQHLADSGSLRAGVSVDYARDILWLVSSPEFYELLVVRRGWSTDDLSRLATATMTAALL